jgi:anti-sigma B factor antagonist
MDVAIDVIDKGPAVAVVVTGEIDVLTAPRLREQLVSLVEEGQRRIVVDLDGVEFIDSTGLGVLVGALKRAHAYNGELALVCNSVRIRKAFEITGLTRVFPMYGSILEACEQGEVNGETNDMTE